MKAAVAAALLCLSDADWGLSCLSDAVWGLSWGEAVLSAAGWGASWGEANVAPMRAMMTIASFILKSAKGDFPSSGVPMCFGNDVLHVHYLVLSCRCGGLSLMTDDFLL